MAVEIGIIWALVSKSWLKCHIFPNWYAFLYPAVFLQHCKLLFEIAALQIETIAHRQLGNWLKKIFSHQPSWLKSASTATGKCEASPIIPTNFILLRREFSSVLTNFYKNYILVSSKRKFSFWAMRIFSLLGVLNFPPFTEPNALLSQMPHFSKILRFLRSNIICQLAICNRAFKN